MEERYHATTQDRFYPDMSTVKKKYYSGGKTYQPTYVITVYRAVDPQNSGRPPKANI